jgi:hypothetical protein
MIGMVMFYTMYTSDKYLVRKTVRLSSSVMKKRKSPLAMMIGTNRPFYLILNYQPGTAFQLKTNVNVRFFIVIHDFSIPYKGKKEKLMIKNGKLQ